MSKVVYYLGAGASCGALPIVNDIPKKIGELIDILELSIKPYKVVNNRKIPKLNISIDLRNGIKEFINDLKWLKEKSEDHYSIDTFAKKLFLGRKSDELEQLKVLLSLFFEIEQIINPPDKRYDLFFASISDSILEFPKNIKVINWNYDSQFEISFSEFVDNYDIKEIRRQLNIRSRSGKIPLSKVDGFGIIKINGTTSFSSNLIYPDRHTLYKEAGEFNESILNDIFQTYKFPSRVDLDFYFAWEKGRFSDISNLAIDEISDADILVIIGYSFPYFNREIDKRIIGSMANLTKVFYQSPQADSHLSRLMAIKPNLRPGVNLIPITKELDSFYIPNELS